MQTQLQLLKCPYNDNTEITYIKNIYEWMMKSINISVSQRDFSFHSVKDDYYNRMQNSLGSLVFILFLGWFRMLIFFLENPPMGGYEVTGKYHINLIE